MNMENSKKLDEKTKAIINIIMFICMLCISFDLIHAFYVEQFGTMKKIVVLRADYMDRHRGSFAFSHMRIKYKNLDDTKNDRIYYSKNYKHNEEYGRKKFAKGNILHVKHKTFFLSDRFFDPGDFPHEYYLDILILFICFSIFYILGGIDSLKKNWRSLPRHCARSLIVLYKDTRILASGFLENIILFIFYFTVTLLLIDSLDINKTGEYEAKIIRKYEHYKPAEYLNFIGKHCYNIVYLQNEAEYTLPVAKNTYFNVEKDDIIKIEKIATPFSQRYQIKEDKFDLGTFLILTIAVLFITRHLFQMLYRKFNGFLVRNRNHRTD